MTIERDKEIARLYAEGMPLRAIGKKMRVGSTTIVRIAREHGMSRSRDMTVPLGAISTCGLSVKIGPSSKDWMTVNRYLWEQAGREPPRGGQVIALKPQYAGTPPEQRTADMLEMSTQADIAMRNRLTRWPRDLQEAIIDLNKLKRSLNK